MRRCAYFGAHTEFIQLMKCFSLFILAALLGCSAFAQEIPTQQSVRGHLENYASGYQQEKIYLHFDKPAYAPGETIWYKAYLMAASIPSVISVGAARPGISAVEMTTSACATRLATSTFWRSSQLGGIGLA